MHTLPATFGRYRLLEHLGTGGMAEVFRAKSYGASGFEKVVVIKRILPHLAKRKEFVEVFIHEAKLAVRLSHANIVQVFDLGSATVADRSDVAAPDAVESTPVDAYYMAMEYVQGLDLGKILAESTRRGISLPPSMCAYVAAEIAKALDHAHRRTDDMMRPLNIVHRDLAPQNTLLSFEGEVKVGDFGIASADEAGFLEGVQEDTQTRRLHGKFAYMSPEQARGEIAVQATDLFSLGVILYEMLTGVSPFHAPSTFETLRRVQACEFAAVSTIRSDVPPELSAIVHKCLELLPNRRFADAGEVHEALLRFLAAPGNRCSAPDLAQFIQRLEPAGYNRDRATAQIAAAREVGARVGKVQDSTMFAPRDLPADRVRFVQLVDALKSSVVDAAVAELVARDLNVRKSAILIVLKRERPEPSFAQLETAFHEHVSGHAIQLADALFGFLIEQPIQSHDWPALMDCVHAIAARIAAWGELAVGQLPSAAHPHGVAVAVVCGCADEPDHAQASEPPTLARLEKLARTWLRATPTAAHSYVILVPELFAPAIATQFNVHAVPGLRTDRAWHVGPRLPAPYLGHFREREREVAALLSQLSPSPLRLASWTVSGPRGIGKSRLIAEVARRLLAQEADSFAVVVTLNLFAVAKRFAGLRGLAYAVTLSLGAVNRVWPVSAAQRADVTHANAQLITQIESSMDGSGAVAESAATHLRNCVVDVLRALTARGPLLLALDTAGGLDADSDAVLRAALAEQAGAAIFVIYTSCGVVAHAASADTMLLTGLSAAGIVSHVAGALSVHQLPPIVAEFVVSAAVGNPGIAEHVAAELQATRTVTIFDSRVVMQSRDVAQWPLPLAWAEQRYASYCDLGPTARVTLGAIATSRTPLRREQLAAALQRTEADIQADVQGLRAQGWLVERATGDLALRTPQFEDVMRSSVQRDTSRRLHLCLAHGRITAATSPEGADAAAVARDLELGGAAALAAIYSIKAGYAAYAEGSARAAANFATSALSLHLSVTDSVPPAHWIGLLTRALRNIQGLVRIRELADRVIGVCHTQLLAVPGRDALLATASLLARAGYFVLAAKVVDDLGVSAPDDSEHFAESRLHAIAQMASGCGRHCDALAIYSKLTRTNLGDAHRARMALSHALSLAAVGKLGEAFSVVAVFDDLASLPLPAHEVAIARGTILLCGRDTRAAVASYEQAVDAAISAEAYADAALGYRELAICFIREGSVGLALGALERSEQLCRTHGVEALAERNRLLLAYLDSAASDEQIATRMRAEVEHAELALNAGDETFGRWLLGRHLLRCRERELAVIELGRANALAKRYGIAIVEQDSQVMLEGLGVSTTFTHPG
jgi:eukaryotic-like serine/threonine-protein kinase